MKKRMFRFLTVILTLLLLAGCAGTPVAPSEDGTVPLTTEPDELVFNGISRRAFGGQHGSAADRAGRAGIQREILSAGCRIP